VTTGAPPDVTRGVWASAALAASEAITASALMVFMIDLPAGAPEAAFGAMANGGSQ
jgi:hypothetical protein